MNYSRVLALDYGTSRVGVAVSRAQLAEPLVILSNSETLWDEILRICREERIEKIILGISDQEMARKTTEFGAQLVQKTNLPVEFIDESFSSQEVQKKLRLSGMRLMKRREPIDHFAAAHILQEWLDTHAPL